MRMVASGRPLAEIAESVDVKYTKLLRYRTPTPLPPLGYVPPAR